MLKMFHFDKLFLAFTKLTKRLRSKESRVHKIWIYEVWKKPSWKVRKTRHQENNPDKPSWGTSFLSRSGNHSSQLPVLYFLICSNWELFHCFLDCLYNNIQPLLSSKSTNSWVCSSRRFWESRADQKLIKKENMLLLILTRPDPDWRQQVDSTPNSRADPLEEGHLRDSWYMLFSN